MGLRDLFKTTRLNKEESSLKKNSNQLKASIAPVPQPQLSFKEQIQSLNEFKSKVLKEIFGQDQAVDSVISALINSISGKKSDSAKEVFMFLGPDSTGKKTLANLIAKYIPEYGKDNVITLDMSKYQGDGGAKELTGWESTWTGSKPGNLTQYVKKHPKSIVILDNFDKAGNLAQEALVPIFDGGLLEDRFINSGRVDFNDLDGIFDTNGKLVADFRNCIVIVTSSLGSEIYNNKSFLKSLSSNQEQTKSTIIEAISREQKLDYRSSKQVSAISTSILPLMGKWKLSLFKKLDFNNLVKICSANLEQETKMLKDARGLSINFDSNITKDAFIKAFLLANGPDFNVQSIKSNFPNEQVFNPVFKLFVENIDKNPSEVNININSDIVKKLNKFILEQGNDIVYQMYRRNKTLDLKTKLYLNSDNVIQFEVIDFKIKQIPKAVDYTKGLGLTVEIPETTWEDVKGHTKAKERLASTINILKNSQLMLDYGVDIPKGILLYGPPGTGKTMLAKAFSNEADLPFISTTGRDLLKDGAIDTVFKKARAYAPSIIFIDEIDAIPKRGTASTGYDNIVNNLLTEINGFSNDDNLPVFIIAATNRKDMLDDALIREGRIGVHIEVSQLDRLARSYFIEKWLKNPVIDFPKDTQEKLLTLTVGMNGSQLEKVEREAIFNKVQTGVDIIDGDMLIEQIHITVHGERNQKKNITELLQETAIHEAGHAVAAWYLLPESNVAQMTIVPRANFGGMVSANYDEKNHDETKVWLMSYTCVCLAGRAAQMKKFGKKGLDAGASQDLAQAMKFAYQAVSLLGMDDELFNINTHAFKEFFNIELFKDENEKRIKHWIDYATQLTSDFVNEHWDEIEKLAEKALEDETLYEEDIKKLLNKRPENSELFDIVE